MSIRQDIKYILEANYYSDGFNLHKATEDLLKLFKENNDKNDCKHPERFVFRTDNSTFCTKCQKIICEAK